MGATGAGTAECFVAGTRIATPTGEVAIETLVEGDAVVTASGATMIVRWVGRRRLCLDVHPRHQDVQPIRITASAFIDSVPACDLYVSPGHGIFVREGGFDRLIPAGCLVNGSTITQVTWSEVDYWHVELDRHDVLLAEGLPAESYLDCGNRAEFESEAGPMVLHPTFATAAFAPEEAACAPFEVAGPVLDAVKARLAKRALMLADPSLDVGAWLRRWLGRRAA